MNEINQVFSQTLKQGTVSKVITEDFLLGNEAVVPTWADDEVSGRDAGDPPGDCVLGSAGSGCITGGCHVAGEHGRS